MEQYMNYWQLTIDVSYANIPFYKRMRIFGHCLNVLTEYDFCIFDICEVNPLVKKYLVSHQRFEAVAEMKLSNACEAKHMVFQLIDQRNSSLLLQSLSKDFAYDFDLRL